MDRNQFVGLLLMLVMITVYFQFFAPDPLASPESIDNQTVVDTVQVQSETAQLSETQEDYTPLSDSAMQAVSEMKYGLFSPVSQGTENKTVLENDEIRVTFSNKGGKIDEVELKNYTKYDGSPLILVDQNHEINILFEHLSRTINLNDLYFKDQVVDYSDSTVITFTLAVQGAQLKQVYSLPKTGYTLGYNLVSNGFEKQIEPKNLTYVWDAQLPKLETDLQDARIRTSITYYTASGDGDYLSKRSSSHEEEMLSEPVKWLAFNQKFFTAGIVSNTAFPKAFVAVDPTNNDQVVKRGSIQTEIAYTDLASNSTSFTYFFGPNDYHILKEVTEDFTDNLELGWFFLPAINKYLIIPIWNFLELFIGDYGLIIIIMVLIIRLLLSPLTYSSHISMAKMRVLKPELDAIKERNGEDMQKAQTEQMDLYRKAGINPVSGCIPVLLQFPILVSLFYFIPAAIDLRLESFLWAGDLSTYDSILNLPFTIPFYGDHVSLFTLLMAGSTILYTMANSQMTTVQGPMKTLQYIMPVMLLFFFNSYPSGLSYYYFVSNLVSFGQIALFRKFIDEDKIKRVMEENRKKNKNKKKSKFQARLEEAMKANQEAQKKNKRK